MHLDTRISLYIRAKTERFEEKSGQSGERKKRERKRETLDRSYRNLRAKSITRRRCSEIVPSSATYSGHWYVPFGFPPPRIACFILVYHPVTRSLPPLPFSSHSSLFSSRLIPSSVSIKTSYRSHEECGEENQHRCILADAFS